MNPESIGTTAGKVWESLKEAGEAGLTVSALKKQTGLKQDEVVAAIGWLAREDKLTFSSVKNKTYVQLASIEQEPVEA